MNETVELLKQKVNRFGELHIDAEQTALLLSHLETVSKILDGYKKIGGELLGIRDDIKRVAGERT